MKKKPSKIKAFTLDYHLKVSRCINELVIKPLQPDISVRFFSWDGRSEIKKLEKEDLQKPLIFFQYPPPGILYSSKERNLIWIPMWDHIKNFSDDWWKSLPKWLKVVAFSHSVFEKAKNNQLRVLRLKYFPDHQNFLPADWRKKRVIMYWNRTGLLGPNFLKNVCQTLQADKLIFQKWLDPKIDKQLYYDLPEKLGDTYVEELPEYLSRKEYLKKINETNIYLAPRASEGVGLTFLEAMARGCAVFSYDAPVMNEVIQHKRNGFFWKNQQDKGFFSLIRESLMNKKKFGISSEHDWNEIASLNLKFLGEQAYRDSLHGHKKWKKDSEKYQEFIFD